MNVSITTASCGSASCGSASMEIEKVEEIEQDVEEVQDQEEQVIVQKPALRLTILPNKPP